MNEELDKVIKYLASLVKGEIESDDALKYTQAMVNAANAKRALKED